MSSVRLFLSALFLLSMAACAVAPTNLNDLSNVAGPYRLGAGDVLRVTVYGDDKLSGSYTVDDTGLIAFPLAGPISAQGLTTSETAARISAALASGYMRSPSVAVEIATYRPFFIQGGVTASGQYPYVYGMTVRAAISTAGGYTLEADRKRATIYRRQGSQTIDALVALDTPIQPGDIIVIKELGLLRSQ